MSQLESLLSITQMQSEKQLAVLQQKRHTIALLNKQLNELVDYAQHYQQDAVGTTDNLVSLLIHRRKFISQLSVQIDEITKRIEKLNDDAADCAAQWNYFEARKNAIQSMYDKQQSQNQYIKDKIAQESVDELARLSSSGGFGSVLPRRLSYA